MILHTYVCRDLYDLYDLSRTLSMHTRIISYTLVCVTNCIISHKLYHQLYISSNTEITSPTLMRVTNSIISHKLYHISIQYTPAMSQIKSLIITHLAVIIPYITPRYSILTLHYHYCTHFTTRHTMRMYRLFYTLICVTNIMISHEPYHYRTNSII